jgi:hypothetical protein
MSCGIEHASITAGDMRATVAFITTALPELKIRGQDSSEPCAWLHVGTEEIYIALTRSPSADPRPHVAYRDPGVNHVGIVVDDVG